MKRPRYLSKALKLFEYDSQIKGGYLPLLSALTGQTLQTDLYILTVCYYGYTRHL